MMDFIFMLTRADRTIADAEMRLDEALAAGVHHIGFKDMGLPSDRLRGLAGTIRKAGATLYLEVVGLDAASETSAAHLGVQLGVDVLMGGLPPEVVIQIIAGSRVRYYPFPGEVVGHPSVLRGSVATIAAHARALAQMKEVDGLDLLAYRFDGDVEQLIEQVVRVAAGKPVVVAGSLDRDERIATLARAGVAAFTVGTAALDGLFPAGASLGEQLAHIAQIAKQASRGKHHMDKVNLVAAFSRFSDHWSPKVAGDINDFQLKLAKFKGSFHWHHHDEEDELFLVISGRLRISLRDRTIELDAGEFMIVPRGVEHLPEALSDECHVVLLERNSTLNTGNVENDRTLRTLDRIG
jgi:mannose-6-phosphate isomerase-like protein (cupin superfamily)